MQQLTKKAAKELAYRYSFLTSFTVRGKKVKNVIEMQNVQNKELHNIVVIIETDNAVIDFFEDLDDFCIKYNLPYPELSL